MKKNVTVWSKTYEVDVYQKSKAVWVATGTFNVHGISPGEYGPEVLQSKGASASTALKALAEQAKYRSN